ncbi:MAG: hypothetical protein ACYTFG_00300 [Planctomycetota bacterium]|jgi:hypothetical protein
MMMFQPTLARVAGCRLGHIFHAVNIFSSCAPHFGRDYYDDSGYASTSGSAVPNEFARVRRTAEWSGSGTRYPWIGPRSSSNSGGSDAPHFYGVDHEISGRVSRSISRSWEDAA